jgi:cation diffusion facilitator family transporter
MAARSTSPRVIYAALIGNLLVAVTKAVAAALTGSSAMLSEAVHSVVDTGNEVLLLYGIARSRRPSHLEHPLGHGRELYFWSFVVALLIFALGAGVSIYEGIRRLRDPEPITDPLVNYAVLGLAFLFEGWTWQLALRQFRTGQGSRGFLDAFRRSKDPPTFMILFEDSAALLGIGIATIGTFAATALGAPVADGIASILIGGGARRGRGPAGAREQEPADRGASESGAQRRHPADRHAGELRRRREPGADGATRARSDRGRPQSGSPMTFEHPTSSRR